MQLLGFDHLYFFKISGKLRIYSKRPALVKTGVGLNSHGDSNFL
jgi:hypothetical protein